MAEAKPYAISKQVVWEAYQKVKVNQGAAGVDGQSIEAFEADLKNNLYKLWNRMSSGSYFPPPVRLVEIPKAGGGLRPLGIPTVADRVAQMVVKMHLEPLVEPHFHPDSYGYRPGKSALDAVATARQRCWRQDWVIDLDIKGFFDNLDWNLVLKAVQHHFTRVGHTALHGGDGITEVFRRAFHEDGVMHGRDDLHALFDGQEAGHPEHVTAVRLHREVGQGCQARVRLLVPRPA